MRSTAFNPAASGSKTCPVEDVSKADLSGLAEWKSKVKWIGEDVGESDKPDLSSAKIVVAGGRAVQSKENFKMVEELAKQLGAAVGATRAAVDAGFAPNDWQAVPSVHSTLSFSFLRIDRLVKLEKWWRLICTLHLEFRAPFNT